MWQTGDPSLGKWVKADNDDYQCGMPRVRGTQMLFTLIEDTERIFMRQERSKPFNSSGELLRLEQGRTYTFSFHYVDGTPGGSAPGMGGDADARSLIWQIHGYPEFGTPCTTLNFFNGGKIGGPQQWALGTCNARGESLMGKVQPVWTGTYTPGRNRRLEDHRSCLQ